MKNKLPLKSAAFLFIVSVYLTIVNLGFTRNFIGDDAGLKYYFPDILSLRTWNLWDDRAFPGVSNVAVAFSFVFNQLLLFMFYIGFSNILIERLLYFSFLFFSALGMFLLFGEVTENNRNKIPALISSSLYMLNYFVMTMLAFPVSAYHVSYVLLPWILYSYIINFNRQTSFQSLFYFALLILLLLSGNPSNTLAIFLVVFSYAVVFIEEIKINKKQIFVFFVLLVLLTSYIYMPLVAKRGIPYNNITIEENLDSLRFNSVNTSFLNLFRFLGYHSQNTFIYDIYLTKDLLYLVISFVVPTSILLSGVLYGYSKKEKYFMMLALFAMLLAKGAHAPFSSVFSLIFKNVFVFQAYRATYFKFEYFVVLSFSILLGNFLLKIQKNYGDKTVNYVSSILGLVIVINSMPMWLGQVARDFHKTTIPHEYAQVRKEGIFSHQDVKMLSVPQVRDTVFKWSNDNHFAGNTLFDDYIFDKQVWARNWFNPFIDVTNVNSSRIDQNLSFLGFYNVKYIVLHKDIPETYNFEVGFYGSPRGQSLYREIEKSLDSSNYVKKIINNGFFSVYELDDKIFLSHFYIPKIITISDSQTFDPMANSSNPRNGDSEAVVFANQNESSLIDRLNFFSMQRPSGFVWHDKISPTRYVVYLCDVNGSIPLVFSELNDPGWTLYVEETGKAEFLDGGCNIKRADKNSFEHKQKFLFGAFQELDLAMVYSKPKRYVLHQGRFVANGYSNGWLIDVADICKNPKYCEANKENYNLVLALEYMPQRFFEIGLIISITTIFMSFIYILVSTAHRKFKKRL